MRDQCSMMNAVGVSTVLRAETNETLFILLPRRLRIVQVFGRASPSRSSVRFPRQPVASEAVPNRLRCAPPPLPGHTHAPGQDSTMRCHPLRNLPALPHRVRGQLPREGLGLQRRAALLAMTPARTMWSCSHTPMTQLRVSQERKVRVGARGSGQAETTDCAHNHAGAALRPLAERICAPPVW